MYNVFLLSCIHCRYSTQNCLDIFQFSAVMENLSPHGAASFMQFTLAPGNMHFSELHLNREFDVFKVKYLSSLASFLLQVRPKAPTTCVLCELQFPLPFTETENSVDKITYAMYQSVD